MAPTTRRGPNTPVNDTNPNNITPESHFQARIAQASFRNNTMGMEATVARDGESVFISVVVPLRTSKVCHQHSDGAASDLVGQDGLGTLLAIAEYCNTNAVSTRREMGQLPQGNGCLSVEHQDTSKEIVITEEQNGGNGMHKDGVYAVWECRKEG
ncbi:hypothetical protein Tco_0386673 [Tanacetum coccineum]